MGSLNGGVMLAGFAGSLMSLNWPTAALWAASWLSQKNVNDTRLPNPRIAVAPVNCGLAPSVAETLLTGLGGGDRGGVDRLERRVEVREVGLRRRVIRVGLAVPRLLQLAEQLVAMLFPDLARGAVPSRNHDAVVHLLGLVVEAQIFQVELGDAGLGASASTSFLSVPS